MEQVVIFSSDEKGGLEKLQRQVNEWFRENSGRVDVNRVLQSSSGWIWGTETTISIFYKKRTR